jgi:hypothetical protein
MKKIVFCTLCILLLWSCGKTGTSNNETRVATPPVEIAQRSAEPADAHPVKITQKSLEHIISRHWSASEAQGAGKFSDEITVSVLKEMIETTAAQGTFRPNTNGRPGQIAEYNFRKPIGTTINGHPATHLRVVIAPNGNLITAFPY